MKQDLLTLIEAIPDIEKKFRRTTSNDGLLDGTEEVIYDNPDFIEWKEGVKFELQQIYNNTRDKYILDIIGEYGVLNEFNYGGFNEKENFNRLKASLYIVQKNIDKYFPKEEIEGTEDDTMLKPKIFISHSSADLKYVEPFVELLADIGMASDNMFCSSVADYGIPLGEDIYEYLSSLFHEYNLHVIFVLSNNYYRSPACMNEMGAAWVLKNQYTSVLLPNFEYKEIKGAANPNKIGIKLDDEEELLKKRLGELKDIISKNFGISVPDIRWENKRDAFISTVRGFDL